MRAAALPTLLFALAQLTACAHVAPAGRPHGSLDAAGQNVAAAKPRDSAATGKTPTNATGAAAAPGPLALGIFDVALPGCPDAATPAQATFCQDASRAVRQIYEDDVDDPSVLLALANALEVDPALAPLAPAWRGPIGHALSRSEGLQRLGPTLRLLRRAVTDAYLDRVTQLYRGVDSDACRRAFALLPADEPHWLEMVVTVEPLGTYPLSRLRRFCLESRTLSAAPAPTSGPLQATHAAAPPPAGPWGRYVAAHWQAWRLGGRGAPDAVRPVRPWHRATAAANETAELAVRATRPSIAVYAAPTATQCTAQRLVLVRRGPGHAPRLAFLRDEGMVPCHDTASAHAHAHAAPRQAAPKPAHAAHRRAHPPRRPA